MSSFIFLGRLFYNGPKHSELFCVVMLAHSRVIDANVIHRAPGGVCHHVCDESAGFELRVREITLASNLSVDNL